MKNPNFLLHGAFGDAFGCAIEFVDPKKHSKHFERVLKFDQYYERPNNRGWPGKGRYSDDSAFSIATTEILLNHDYPFTPIQFADSFVNVFHRDRREGYARNFQAFMERTKTGEDFIKNISPGSDKNGAMMRVVPCGLLPTEEQVLNTAKLQAELTHNTGGGVLSSMATALLAHYAYYDKGSLTKPPFKKYANKFGLDMRCFDEQWKWPVVGPYLGVKTFHAVYELVTQRCSMMDILKWAICWTGDVDSSASVAFQIASFNPACVNDIPEWMYNDLEVGKTYGPAFLEQLGKQLMEKYDDRRA